MCSETNLRRQFYFQLPRQILSLELCVLSDIGGDHSLDLLGFQQETKAKVIHTEENNNNT